MAVFSREEEILYRLPCETEHHYEKSHVYAKARHVRIEKFLTRCLDVDQFPDYPWVDPRTGAQLNNCMEYRSTYFGSRPTWVAPSINLLVPHMPVCMYYDHTGHNFPEQELWESSRDTPVKFENL